VPAPTPTRKREIVTIVDQILEAKRKHSSTANLEKKLDDAVFTLYGLTEREIALVLDHKAKVIDA
jgi:hypothetical protein